MLFNTAIFYDIENLVRGYSFTHQMVKNLCIKEILESVRETGLIQQIAMQRAYANWSDYRLGLMRDEINELGIEPIQVFGFSKTNKKNAADIQLAIDVIDLAHIRPALEVFVIVSGDGGFATLAKKLHEYGKTVIGCAYKSATNRVFRAVCDEFVWIDEPDEEEQKKPYHETRLAVTDPRNVRLFPKMRKFHNVPIELYKEKTLDILKLYSEDTRCRNEMKSGGMFLSVVQEAVKYTIDGFQTINLGFAKFIEYMQYVCSETEYCIARSERTQAALCLREYLPDDYEVLPDQEPKPTHSQETYLAILATGVPVFRLPPPEEMKEVINWLAQNPLVNVDLSTAIDEAAAGLADQVSTESVKSGLLCLLSANIFDREPEGVPLAEQKLTISKTISSRQEVVDILKAEIMDKLNSVLPDVRTYIVNQLLPEYGK